MSGSLDKGRVKICILTSAHPAFDERIFHKEAKTLVKAGYDVVLIARHNKEETVDGVRIVPLPEPRNRFERMTKVVWKLFRLALKEKANVYHFHDPELILIGVGLKLLGKKVIYDVHEDYPKDMLDKPWIGGIHLRKIVAFAVHAIEQAGSFFLSGIIAATPDIAKKFNSRKTVCLRNYPVVDLIDCCKKIGIKKEKPILIFIGGLYSTRMIKEIIQAMELVKNKAELWLLGKWESEEYKKECEDLEGWKYTKYLGLKKFQEVFQYVKMADIGLNLSYCKTNYPFLPVKAFEYMACSLAIVTSDFPDRRKVFKECALFANPENPEDIASKILYLLNNIGKTKELAKKGRQLIEERYNWQVESEKLLKIYESITRGGHEQ